MLPEVLRVAHPPQEPGKGHLIGVTYIPKSNDPSDGYMSHCSVVTQIQESNPAAENSPWRFVRIKPPSEPAGLCLFPISINETTTASIKDMQVSDSVSHLYRGNRYTKAIFKCLWKLCTYIIHVPEGENTSPSSFLQLFRLMLPEADICCNYY